MNDSRALTAANDSILSTALTPQSVVAQVALIQQIMQAVMKDGEHYGTIPGCGDKKVLFKSGAEKLCFAFQLVPTFSIDERQMDGGHREYRIVTKLATRSGVPVGEGIGACSTMEPKYRYRNAGIKCPKCGKETVIKGKAEYGGGWLCFAKKGGCNAKWADGSKEIEGQAQGKIDNPDPAELYNTVLKMGKKRSIVDATITACAASDIFTQDLEELPEYENAPPEMTQAQRNAAAASDNARDVPTHNLKERAEATRLWEIAKTRNKSMANTIRRECATDAAQAIRKFKEMLDADGIDYSPVVITGTDEASNLDAAAAGVTE